MSQDTLITIVGVSVGLVSGIATLLTLVFGIYSMKIQWDLRKKTRNEFNEHFQNMLNKASSNPGVLEKFIDNIVEKEEFKNRFLALIKDEIENILDSRDILKDKRDADEVKFQFQQKERE
ncbi:hypothetical protein LW135_06510 [Helicobacter sp. faydin-H20]|uniref:hypothetical protein n=1 Tax=Helicobacter anatolicus TaxID=2905874 RepID=UPI001E56CC38|nr:hypothetical protein [Helicobacter anatolicus]MCE3037471.1 hypothetical protein [Helicobacter anatolicus]